MSIAQSRNRYTPKQLKVLFVAEAIPDNPDRFFYYDKSQEHDWLYLALMRALYRDARKATAQELRANKPVFLARFQQDGYYLIDAIDDPVAAGTTSKERTAMVRENAGHKVTEIKNLLAKIGGKDTK